MSAASHELISRAPCPCGDWQFRRLAIGAAAGFSAVDDFCPRCRHRYILVFRVVVGTRPRAWFVLAVRIDGRGEAEIRRALAGVPDMTTDDVDFMVAVAVDLARGGA